MRSTRQLDGFATLDVRQPVIISSDGLSNRIYALSLNANHISASRKDEFMEILVALVAILAVVIILIAIAMLSRNVIEWHRNNQQPVISVQARVIGKRPEVSGSSLDSGGSTSTCYYCTFELTTGQRLEYIVPGKQYGLITEGDAGILTFQGTRYHGFQRR